jgi:outer membrane protein W
MHKKTVTLALGAVVALAASGAFADNANPNDVRVGMYFVYFDTSATDINGPYTPAGLNLKVNSLETVYLAYVRSFSTHIKVEIAFGVPPLTRTVGSGPSASPSPRHAGSRRHCWPNGSSATRTPACARISGPV